MEETFRGPAIILRHYPVGENHRNIVLLSEQGGLFSATVYGAQGRKNPFRPLIFPFHQVHISCRHDRVRDRWQVKDMTSLNPFEKVRDEVERYYTASLWAEILMKSRGSGNPESGDADLFTLVTTALRALETLDRKRVFYLSATLLWLLLADEGIQPDLTRCSRCGRLLEEAETLFWEDAAESFLCARCTPRTAQDSPLMPLPPGARRYLQRIDQTASEEALIQAGRVTLDQTSGGALRRILYHIWQAHLEKPLKTLASGLV